MRTLTIDEKNLIAGGTQYLAITTSVEFEGIPDYCIANFFSANQNNLSSFIVDELGYNIISHCSDFDNVTNFSYSMNLTPTSILLFSE